MKLAAIVLAVATISVGVAGGALTERRVPFDVVPGRDSRVIPFVNTQASPLLFILAGRSSENFVVWSIHPDGHRVLLVNTIGSYDGVTLDPYAPRGRYRLVVQAKGLWDGGVTRITPFAGAPSILRRFTHRGDYVVEVQAQAGVTPTIAAHCRCTGNFVVWLRDFHGGGRLLVNEVGNYTGETTAPTIHRGRYLLQVQASGAWAVTFSK